MAPGVVAGWRSGGSSDVILSHVVETIPYLDRCIIIDAPIVLRTEFGQLTRDRGTPSGVAAPCLDQWADGDIPKLPRIIERPAYG